MNRKILVGISDTHAGHNEGLLNPETILERDDETGEVHEFSPEPTPFQELLYANYLDHMDKVVQLADGDDIVVIHNGDLTQGNKYEENWVSSRLSDQIIIAYYNMRPWLKIKNVKAMRLAKGTGSHVFKEGSSEILVTKLLRTEFPEKNLLSVYHGLLTLNNYKIDYAHHGPHPGTREWTKGNVAILYLRDAMKRSLKMGRTPPDLFLRGHFHRYVHVGNIEAWGENDEYISTLVVLPSYCGFGENAVRATRSLDTLQIGMCAFEIIDGKLLNMYRFIETYDTRTQEEVTDNDVIG